MPAKNYTETLDALRDFTSREKVDLRPPASGPLVISSYAPITKYVLDLKNGAKPESAAEDLFTALCQDVLGFQPTRQVGVAEGYVDFMLPERMGEPMQLELKPLFLRGGPDTLWRSDANPKNHVAQVKKYLRDHEYLTLTDLRTAWFFNARDFYFENKPFAAMPFADFLGRCRETRSVLDTLRRVEDTAEKPELEQQFFADLKTWFNEFDKVKWTPPDQAAESIILLINKLIFARTIEDFGLVPYRFTQDEYIRQTHRWEAKGAHRIVPKFLDEFEDFFDEYYDTEIFSQRVWERLDKDPANLQRFCDKLNFVLGINTWDQAFSRGIVHYNYRRIDEDIFGKSYEMFLAANRKDEGIYYTPAGITGPMADSLVQSLAGKLVDDICAAVGSQKCDFPRANELMAQLAEIRVADTACGSGGFLIKVLRSFWLQYQRVEQACAWVQKILKPDNGELYLAELPPNVEAALAFRRAHNFENPRILIAQILLRHVFGVDKDPGAIEVAKTNIWKEAVKLSPSHYNYRELKSDVVKILPNLELNFHSADSLVDVELDKQAAWLAEYHQAELKKLADSAPATSGTRCSTRRWMKLLSCATSSAPTSSSIFKAKACLASPAVSPSTSGPAGSHPTANKPNHPASTASSAIRRGRDSNRFERNLPPPSIAAKRNSAKWAWTDPRSISGSTRSWRPTKNSPLAGASTRSITSGTRNSSAGLSKSRVRGIGICSSSSSSAISRSSARPGSSRSSCLADSKPTKAAPTSAAGSSPNIASMN